VFDGTIHLGDVLTLIGIGVTLIALHSKNTRRFTSIETKVDMLFDWFRESVVKRKKE